MRRQRSHTPPPLIANGRRHWSHSLLKIVLRKMGMLK
jgi:hypothetical protein